jgi:hypothetical protein
MVTRFALLSFFLFITCAHASNELRDQVPECSVLDEPRCDVGNASVGHKMDCMRSAIKRRKICDEKAKILIDEMESELKDKDL